MTPSQDPMGVGASIEALQVLTGCSASQGAQVREESAKIRGTEVGPPSIIRPFKGDDLRKRMW